MLKIGQHSLLVEHLLSVPEEHGSNPGGRENVLFLSCAVNTE